MYLTALYYFYKAVNFTMYKNKITVQNSPIEYKQIRPTDFSEYGTSNDDFVQIQENDSGYISDFLTTNIDLYSKDTTVINASVGQGKTTALL